jgi:hypothetical protein
MAPPPRPAAELPVKEQPDADSFAPSDAATAPPEALEEQPRNSVADRVASTYSDESNTPPPDPPEEQPRNAHDEMFTCGAKVNSLFSELYISLFYCLATISENGCPVPSTNKLLYACRTNIRLLRQLVDLR